ncbi:MAG: hypothetical protein E4H10_02775 [Bacteroidia bacterium]|nr:MAG: hypothetical protein E4H10_02775 [Bacteroidia bacterium]
MKSYLRLLFVGSVLLVLLGLFNNQRSDQTADRSEPAELEQTAVHSGFLPLENFHITPQSLSSQNYNEGLLENMRLHQETHRSRISKNEFLVARQISRDISPGLLQRPGHFIYCHSGAEVPS